MCRVVDSDVKLLTMMVSCLAAVFGKLACPCFRAVLKIGLFSLDLQF